METMKIQASFILMIFHNDHNGYGVARFVTYDKQEKEFTVTGIMGEFIEDQVYDLYGHYEEHPRYGMQFQLERYEKTRPNDINSLVRYFSSASFPGIGKKLAEHIVDALGEHAIEQIQKDPEVLNQISGLSEKKCRIVIEGVAQLADMDDSVVFFTKYGIPPQMIAKIQAAYGEDAVALVKENPYRMVADVDGIGFATADKLAKSFDFDEAHPYRLKAAVLSAVLSACMSSGDSYTSRDQIRYELLRMLDMEPASLEDILQELVSERNVMMEWERIYHHSQYDAERGIATFLASFPYVEINQTIMDLEDQIADMEAEFHLCYEEKQKKAIEFKH